MKSSSVVLPLLEAQWLNEGAGIADYWLCGGTSLIPEHLKEVRAHKEAASS